MADQKGLVAPAGATTLQRELSQWNTRWLTGLVAPAGATTLQPPWLLDSRSPPLGLVAPAGATTLQLDVGRLNHLVALVLSPRLGRPRCSMNTALNMGVSQTGLVAPAGATTLQHAPHRLVQLAVGRSCRPGWGDHGAAPSTWSACVTPRRSCRPGWGDHVAAHPPRLLSSATRWPYRLGWGDHVAAIHFRPRRPGSSGLIAPARATTLQQLHHPAAVDHGLVLSPRLGRPRCSFMAGGSLSSYSRSYRPGGGDHVAVTGSRHQAACLYRASVDARRRPR